MFFWPGNQSCLITWPTVTWSEWCCFIFLPGSLINNASCDNSMWVMWLLYVFARQSHQSCLTPMTNRQWATLVCFFARQSHQWVILWPTVCETLLDFLPGILINHWCLVPWPTVCEWHYFISFLCQTVTPIMSNHREWVSLDYIFARQSHQLCLFPWQTGSEWHCFTYIFRQFHHSLV